MDRGDSKTPGLERTLSTSNSLRPSVQGGEGDGFDFADATIADGFRPPQSTDGLAAPDAPATPTAPRSPPISPTDVRPSPSSPTRPPSIAKHHRTNDSFSLRHDGAMGLATRPARGARSPSVATDSQPYIQAESPYQGPSNPSHPYQMYAQDVRVARTASVATTSTAAPPDPSYAGPRRPAHPYSMYPQGTVVESEPAPATVIPVGFPGIPDQYQRRIGPDGEEIGDMIGPDGHTEQLPPYTRYPDEPYAAKVDVASQPDPAPVEDPPIAAQSRLAVPPPAIPGAGGIGLATRDPEFDHGDGLESPASRQSCRSFSSDASNRAINAAAAGHYSEKQFIGKGHWGRRRLCGVVPLWAIYIAIILLVVMAVILGAVIGTVMKHGPRHGPGNSNPSASASLTFTYDASAIPTPTNLPALPTGYYTVPLSYSAGQGNCFSDAKQSQTWGCGIINSSGLSLTVEAGTDAKGNTGYTAVVSANQSVTLGNNVYSYGQQPPVISSPISLSLVTDTLEPNLGPAWFGMKPYTKTIIIPGDALPNSGSSVSSRQLSNYYEYDPSGKGSDFHRKSVAQSGDTVWICTWPQTYLEIFIYVTNNSTSATSTTAQMLPTSSSTSTQTPTMTTSHDIAPSQFVSYTEHKFTTPTAAAFTSIGTGNFAIAQEPQQYPRVIKLEERRVSGSTMPMCRQFKVVGGGQPAVSVKDSKGHDVVVNISEVEQQQSEKSVHMRDVYHRDYVGSGNTVASISPCGCVWFVS